MPNQKTFQFDQDNPTEIEAVFALGKDLREDGWGVTIVANEKMGRLMTNAPSNILDFHAQKQSV